MALMPDMPSKVHTYTGRWIDPLDLKPEDVCIEDIAGHLGNQCRWSGGTREFFSVAQHSVICSHMVEEDIAWEALHHDDAEYILQDMAKPLKNHKHLGRAYRGLEKRIEKVIAEVFNLIYPFPPGVKVADTILLVTEARDLVHGTDDWTYYKDIVPADFKIVPWSPRRSRKEFMLRYEVLNLL